MPHINWLRYDMIFHSRWTAKFSKRKNKKQPCKTAKKKENAVPQWGGINQKMRDSYHHSSINNKNN